MAGGGHEPSELELVGRIYDASLEPELWQDVLAAFAERIGASSGSLSFHHVTDRVLSLVKLHGRDERFLPAYREHFVHVNPYLDALTGLSGTRYLSHAVLPEDELVTGEYYQDWLRPQDIHYSTGSVLFQDDARLGAVAWQRPRRAGPFGQDAVAEVARFEPHFRRALTINQKFWDLLAQSNAALAVLDNMALGVIFVNERKEVVYLNPAAEAMVGLEDGLVVRRNRIATPVPEQTAQLDALLDGAVQTGAGLGTHPGGTMWCGLLADRSYQVLVSPLRNQRNDLGLSGKRVCAAVFVSSPYQPYTSSVQSLRTLHGLTAAEANIVSELANGLTVRQIAEKLALSMHTVRTHLRSVFQKTGTRRQADLARLVRCSPTAVIAEGVLLGPALAGPLERRQHRERRRAARATDTGAASPRGRP